MSEQLLLRPAEPKQRIVARLSYDGDRLRLYYPQKDDRLSDIANRFDLNWKRPFWAVAIEDETERRHRAAELASHLLAGGFFVKVETAVAQMVIEQSFTPMVRRKLLVHDGWFLFWWQRTDDWYDAIKTLPGSRYDKPGILVPPEQFEAVRDFCQQHDFLITPEAQALMGAAEAELEAAIVVELSDVAGDTAVPPVMTGIPKKLTVPNAVEIDEALLDEDDD